MRAGRALVVGVLTAAGLFASICGAQEAKRAGSPPLRTEALPRPGRFSLAVAVTGADGAPVKGLTAADVQLEDNGRPSPIFSVTSPGADGPFQVVLVVDELNGESRHIRRDAQQFLRQDGGHLAWPVSVFVLETGGLVALGDPSRDGNLLADRLKHPGHRAVTAMVERRGFAGLSTQDRVLNPAYREVVSRDSLGSMILRLRGEPGRKLVLWMGAGWMPVHMQMESLLNPITEFSTRMREARMVLDWVNEKQPSWYKNFSLNAFVRPALTERDAVPERLALPVLAVQSGGQIVVGETMTEALPRLVQQAAATYTVTFDPAYTDTVDDYHSISLTVSRPGAAARTVAGYYDEPSYFDQPNRDAEPVSVAQLDAFVRDSRRMSGSDGRHQLARMKLTERLSTAHLDELLPLLKDAEERQQLTAVADASAFLRLPSAEMPNEPVPTEEAQRAMIQSAYAYLQKAIPKLPDFFAERETTYYEPRPIKQGHTWKTFTGDASLHPAAVSTATVLYRDGKEEVSDEVSKSRHGFAHKRALEAEGEFGVALKAILYGAVEGGTVGWDHWERGAQGV